MAEARSAEGQNPTKKDWQMLPTLAKMQRPPVRLQTMTVLRNIRFTGARGRSRAANINQMKGAL